LQARTQLMLGLSSHSLWELARAAGDVAGPTACGPVQATTTKDMPWRPQGLHNLQWWVAHSPAPVVGIGGLLGGDDLARFAPIGAAALCVVRALTDAREPLNEVVAALSQAAMATAPEMAEPSHRPAPLPTPVLTSARG